MWDILLPILGFFIGVIAAMTGVGGGIFVVPLLTLCYSFSPSMAVGTSLAAIVLTAFAATLNYSRQKRIYYKVGFLLVIATAPGAIIGAYLTSIIPSQLLGFFFGVFLLFVAYRLLMKTGILKISQTQNKKEESTTDIFNGKSIDKHQAIIGAPLIFLGGVASGLFGVGGGIIIVPILIFLFKIPIHYAVATSMFAMIFTSLSGVSQHLILGNIDWTIALLIGIGSVIGAQVGAQLSKKISGRSLQIIFSIFLLLVALQMIIKFI